MRKKIICGLLIALKLSGILRAESQDLGAGFAQPPEQTKPWCYWYWISDNLSKEGITKDLEAMARVGIGEALIGNIFLDEVPAGSIKVLSPEWWGLVEHAIREGGRVGVNLGLFNCPGWSQSGGPWIKPEETMRYLTSSETRVSGPVKFNQKLPRPTEHFQDVAVLAFPAPLNDTDALAARSPRVTCTPAAPGAEKLVDGDMHSAMIFPPDAGRKDDSFVIQIDLAEPMTARTLQLFPALNAFAAEAELQAATADGRFETVRRFRCDFSNLSTAVGFIPSAPITLSFAPTESKSFRLLLSRVRLGHRNQVPSKQAALAEINLSSAARLESYVEKQLGRMHAEAVPMWDAYLWPTPAEPDAKALVVPHASVHDLSRNLAGDGTLRWEVPAGDWIILRTGMTPTGMSNSPASPEGAGFEVDKMNRKLAKRHFEAFVGELLKRMPASDRKALKQVVADSYEMGAQNWTDGFGEQFQERYGYDPKPWLATLTGRIVGSADQTERFLWDLRRLVADRVATDYVGGLRDASRQSGLGLWLENYGHWGFPSEFLKYGSESDRVAGEYWVDGALDAVELRAASSCVNTYGKMPIVSAEAFTGGPAFKNAPAGLKARGDWAFCEGINHFVLHVYIHQPWEDKVPGVNAPWGSEFNRHNTWFEAGKTWIEYLRRSCWLLQQGNRVADVAYFIGEDTPKMTGVREPALPRGRDFDYINADVIETKLRVQDGVLTLPHGTSYRVLVLPEQDSMRPELLRKIRDLVKAGATVLGPPPSRSPSLQNHPQCDDEVRQLARELWGGVRAAAGAGERRFGKGRVVWGQSLEAVFASLNSPPDFESEANLRFTHRRTAGADIYFVASPQLREVTTMAAFRVGRRMPELWWPDSGRIERPAVYDVAEGRVRLPLALGPQASVCVVFREPASRDHVVSVTRDGQTLFDTKAAVKAGTAPESVPATNNFTLAVWARPAADTTIFREEKQGAGAWSEARNDALFPPHGGGLGGSDHAGSGMAIGRNGVVVLEHSSNYFAPLLACTSSLTNWTHVAVVYRDGQPSLYLNGKLAHSGLRSDFKVHPGTTSDSPGSKDFRGQLGEFQVRGALSDREIVALMQTMPRPDQQPPGGALRLVRGSQGKLDAQVALAGTYELKMADGQTRKIEVASLPEPIPLDGPWEVSFTPGWGAPGKVSFDTLEDWTKRPEEAIRHYSGKATYRKSFEVPAPLLADRQSQIILDLGEVRDLATVRVNGQPPATLWLAPWQVDITAAVKPGANALEVEVVNVWNNRLAGDAALPPEQRRTFIATPTVKHDTALQPAGLLGPVNLRMSSRIAVSLSINKQP